MHNINIIKVTDKITENKEYNKFVLTCSCGYPIIGNSKDNVNALMKQHLRGSLHNRMILGMRLIENKKRGGKRSKIK